MDGAIELRWPGSATRYAILPIHELDNDGPRFRLQGHGGSHVLSADDVRANWSGWVRALLRDDQIVDAPPAGLKVY